MRFQTLINVICLLTFMVLGSCSDSSDKLKRTRQAWMVMGTTLEITVYRPASESAQSAGDLEAAYQEILEIDARMSLYRPNSELVQLNTRAGKGGVTVSEKTLNVLRAANHFSNLSDLAFDISVKPLIDLWGFYDVATASVPERAEIEAVQNQIGFGSVEYNEYTRLVTLEAGAGIDLGAIAKGYAVDMAISVLRSRSVPSALVNLGGNVGVLGLAPGGKPWVVGIRHPRSDKLISMVSLTEGAVATSGDYDRYFEVDGQRYSHLLNPRTGYPVDGLYSLSVVASNAITADALSTAAFILGPEVGAKLLSDCLGVEGLFVEVGDGSEGLLATITDGPAGAVFELGAGISGMSPRGSTSEVETLRLDCLWPS
ncbi:MAG: FAD:protein FMN transferase [Rhodospirillaceae bacterium]|nr:FAD:protein FMN transferase [Rhodospirillaceae bacterium]